MIYGRILIDEKKCVKETWPWRPYQQVLSACLLLLRFYVFNVLENSFWASFYIFAGYYLAITEVRTEGKGVPSSLTTGKRRKVTRSTLSYATKLYVCVVYTLSWWLSVRVSFGVRLRLVVLFMRCGAETDMLQWETAVRRHQFSDI